MENRDHDRGTGRRLLLGGLSALALNPDTRRKVVGGTRDLLGTAQEALDETVKPVLATVADEAGQVAQTAHKTARKTEETLGALREELPDRAQSRLKGAGQLVEEAATTGAAAVGTATARASDLARDLRRSAAHGLEVLGEKAHDFAGERRQDAERARRQVKRDLRVTQKRVAQKKAQTARAAGKAALSAEAHRRAAAKALGAAHRAAERDLFARRRSWSAEQIERAVERQLAPLNRQTLKELARLEKEGDRRARAVRAEVGARSARRGGGGGALLGLALLGTGAVVLARVPAARQAILDAVGSVNPEAEQSLRRAGRNARNLVGTMWLERLEEAPAPAPAAARGTRAATTGATWGGSPAAGSPAAAGGTPPTAAPAPNPEDKTN